MGELRLMFHLLNERIHLIALLPIHINEHPWLDWSLCRITHVVHGTRM